MDLPALDLQSPNILGSYLQGVQGSQALAMMPYQMQQAQQQTAAGALNLQQLQLALRSQQMYSNLGMRMLTGQGGTADQGSASPSVGRTGGIQNGPQDPVAGMAGGRSATPLTGPTQASGSYDGSFGGSHSLIDGSPSPETAMALEYLKLGAGGQGDPIAAMKNALAYRQQVGQLQWSTDNSVQGEAFLRQMATSPDAPQVLKNNMQTLGPQWAQAAFAAGADARDLSAHNVNKVAAMLYNQKALSLQMSPISAPTHFNPMNIGEGGVANVDADTGKIEAGIGRQEPTKVGERYNADTGQMEAVYKEFAPSLTPGASGVPGGSASPGSGAGGTTAVPVGLQKPSDQELKSAMFAGEFRSGNETMSSMEGQGFRLTPSARSIAVNMATEEDPGAMKQLLSQEVAAHKLTEGEKTYIAAMMPMLQATGHDQSGARLTTAQIRQNLESLVPFSDSNQSIDQIQKNRQGFYTGLLTQAGPATQLPQYRNTLASDLKNIQSQASAPVSKSIGGKTYYKVNGRWFDNAQGK